ncbi:PTS fructose transporter subunit IIC [Coriobacteriaceae bacterium]|uniref:PTS fructose transporter subunit IIC n=1 Tax=Granulimonas faecalis TaxID=2894155 RepID=A0AAV5B239_9ACTN|nr:PTS fructose transporter subunit IIC [Granulimonas faecalis]MBF0599277.1 PTS fructose transporter subunit IIC [Atopobiaceae bacterium FL090493]TGY60526.1 PTS fructose transporter subunit IIC [Coriobacteriaceae bacterium]GJM55580.1 PTS fructose transporter subunit IIC [Granulimonas faecalis]
MAELARKGAKSAKKSQGAVIKEAIFTGVSYMIPVIVGGGVLQGIAKAMGGYDIAQQAAELAYTQFTFAMVLNAIGAAIMNLSVPIIGAYSAYAIAEKPGLAPGFAVGFISVTTQTGFLGALVGGILAGYLVNWMKDLMKKAPKDLQSVFPILLIPVCATLIVCLAMWYVIGVPIAWFMGALTTFLTGLEGGSRFIFGAAIGAMMSIDQGGPIGKATALFTNGLNADGVFGPTASKMCGGMQNPIGICIAMLLGGKKKFAENERQTIVSGLILGCCYIQEYVIPFLVKDPIRVLVCCMCGGAVSGGLAMTFGLESMATHGGVFVVPLMTASADAPFAGPVMFLLCWLAGALVTGVSYALVKAPISATETDTGNPILDNLV